MSFFATRRAADRFLAMKGWGSAEVVKAYHDWHEGNAMNMYMFYIAGETYEYIQVHNITSLEGRGVDTGTTYVFKYVNLGGSALDDDAQYQLVIKPGAPGLQTGLESKLWSCGHSNLRM